MAILSSDGTYVTVEKGDTLWNIAKTHLGSGSKYTQLAAINNISNPQLISVGQKIYLSSSSSGSSGSSGGSSSGGSSSSSGKTSTSTSTSKPVINQFGLQSDADGVLFATWTWNKSQTASYKVVWLYDTGNNVWFVGNESTITVDKDAPDLARQSLYNIPSNALWVRFKVKPISETVTKNNKETNVWTAEWSDVKTWTNTAPLTVPSVPSLSVDKYKLLAEIENTPSDATHVQFQFFKNNGADVYKSSINLRINSGYISCSCYVEAGGKYKVRCRAYNETNKRYSDWTAYSSNVETMPATPAGFIKCKAISESSVYLEWEAVTAADTYDIQYSTKQNNLLEGSNDIQTATGITGTTYNLNGLETGQEYFFRIRAINKQGETAWSEKITSIVIGKAPTAPTTWSSTTTAITGDPLNLYWVHNAEDGSSQTFAVLEIYVDGVVNTYTIQNSTDEEEKDKTSVYSIDTSKYVEGTKIEWRVRTAGVTKVAGEWSIQRTIDIYAPATLELKVTNSKGGVIDTLTELPFYISGVTGPKTQVPTGYHVSVVSNDTYETVDNIGDIKIVNAGDEVYSKYFDTSEPLLLEMSAHNISLDNNIDYTVTCTASMNSGLSVDASSDFTVKWADRYYDINAEIGVDLETLTASIRPYCESGSLVYYKVLESYGIYIVTSEVLDSVWGEIVPGATTTKGNQVYSGITASGEELYFCKVEEKTKVDNVFMSVYRREFDGSFTEIGSNLDVTKNTSVVDPHPSLDFARYRIVAISSTTGAVSFYDLPGYPVGGTAVIIQWDEDWVEFDTDELAPTEKPPWAGSMLRLPYNIDISDKNDSDVALIKYIGRANPVTYYGTQIGATATWSVEIEKSDKDTLYALRRLQRWMGDVYVREPSGSGYWANIKVSFSQKHKELTIPVTLDVTRVEGGM